MRITVVRHGGFAGLSREWSVEVTDPDDLASWQSLIDQLPWSQRPTSAPQPDRYIYRIRVSRRRITLPEQKVAGPWRELVDRVKTAAEG